MDYIDYRERLGIDFEDDERGRFCTALILNKLDDMFDNRSNIHSFDLFDYEAVSHEEFKWFCMYTGTQYGNILSAPKAKILDILIAKVSSLKKFLVYYMAFVNCLTNRENGIKQKNLLTILDESFRESKLQYALLIDGNKYFVFPKGAKELDDGLVSEPLEWLKDYQNSHRAFVKALKSYSEVTEDSASDVADLFRKSLETFFQEFFETAKTLENLKSEYGTYMKSKRVPTEISNNLETLQLAYTNFINNYAKHHDKTSLNVLEYIMYQTGNIIRLLITLKQEADVDAN